ncbi:hypothetical protein NEMBOFW57_003892 [Staphylotrichum longicolle]|uniref:Protein kinase domain-containing protein n=1 Tax=Staphylotrichum longicolle TaxID=669026 RepID=A0AAD4F651_9PEZI|nr:hypothetical protein NEMBOFW57_003892 [Staphylotrichum longicolle]
MLRSVKMEGRPTTEHTFTITGTKTLRRFGIDEGGAQVLTGYVDRDEAQVYLAKVYDGVYYPLEDWHTGRDCMLLADYDYAVEAWAYETMQGVETVGKKLIPTCYGGWTFSLPTNQPGRHRWVRMLLLELIHAESMFAKILRATENDAVQYSLLPPEQFRLRVLKSLFEAVISIWWDAEVLHDDLESRNVLVRDDGTVVIVDFNQAFIYRYIDHQQHPKYFEDEPQLPPSPIQRYWPFVLGGSGLTSTEDSGSTWANWIPQSWLGNQDLAAEWLLKTWEDSPPGRYRPLEEEFLNHPSHAQRGKKVLAALERLGRKPASMPPLNR